jgi:hypothetical protein
MIVIAKSSILKARRRHASTLAFVSQVVNVCLYKLIVKEVHWVVEAYVIFVSFICAKSLMMTYVLLSVVSRKVIRFVF